MAALVSYIIGSLFNNVKTYTRHVVMLATKESAPDYIDGIKLMTLT